MEVFIVLIGLVSFLLIHHICISKWIIELDQNQRKLISDRSIMNDARIKNIEDKLGLTVRFTREPVEQNRAD